MSNAEATKGDMFDEIAAIASEVVDGLRTEASAKAYVHYLAEQFGQFGDAIEIGAWMEEDIERLRTPRKRAWEI